MPVCCRGLRLGRGLGVADAAFRRGDFAIVVHRIGLFFALLFDHVGLVFHGVLRRAWRPCVGLIVDGFGLGLRLIRAEELRVGKECVSTFSVRGAPLL